MGGCSRNFQTSPPYHVYEYLNSLSNQAGHLKYSRNSSKETGLAGPPVRGASLWLPSLPASRACTISSSPPALSSREAPHPPYLPSRSVPWGQSPHSPALSPATTLSRSLLLLVVARRPSNLLKASRTTLSRCGLISPLRPRRTVSVSTRPPPTPPEARRLKKSVNRSSTSFVVGGTQSAPPAIVRARLNSSFQLGGSRQEGNAEEWVGRYMSV